MIGDTKPSEWSPIEGKVTKKNSVLKALQLIADEHALPWSSGAGAAAVGAAAAGGWPEVEHLLQSDDLKTNRVVNREEHLRYLAQEAAKGTIHGEVARRGPSMRLDEPVPRNLMHTMAREQREIQEALATIDVLYVRPTHEHETFISSAAKALFDFDHARTRGHPYMVGPHKLGKTAAAISALVNLDPKRRPALLVKRAQLKHLYLVYKKIKSAIKDLISGIILEDIQFDVDRIDAISILSGGYGDGACTIPGGGRGELAYGPITIDPGTKIIFCNNPASPLFKDKAVMGDEAITTRLRVIRADSKMWVPPPVNATVL